MLIRDWPNRERLHDYLVDLVAAQEELWGRMRDLENYLGTDLELEEWVEYAAISPGDCSTLVDGFMAEFGDYDTEDDNG